MDGSILMAAAAAAPQPAAAPQSAIQQTTVGEELQQAERGRASNAADIIVTGRRVGLIGTAITASEGRVGAEEMRVRPLLRSGDLLEFVPGLVATQHSGSGKANRYFLRGFNLDHGTDFATLVDGADPIYRAAR